VPKVLKVLVLTVLTGAGVLVLRVLQVPNR